MRWSFPLLLLFYTPTRSLHITLQEGFVKQMGWQCAYSAAEKEWKQDTHFVVSSNENGTKLALYCAVKLGSSIKRSKELAKEGLITVKDALSTENKFYKSYGTRRLLTGDEVYISGASYQEQLNNEVKLQNNSPEKMQKLLNFVNNLLEPSRNPPLQVLYEDEDVAVVLKPAGTLIFSDCCIYKRTS